MSYHWKGFWLSLLTASMWGILPIFLKLCLQVMDSSTITWYRFAFASVVVFVVLASSRALPRFNRLGKNGMIMIILAAFALVVNYVANVQGLEYIDAETVQIVMQLAPFMLMLGGVLIFKESFSRVELSGAGILLVGFFLFFSQRIGLLLTSLNEYSFGVAIIAFAAVAWAGYALTQKVLLRTLTAKQLTLLIYILGVIILLPFANLTSLMHMNGLQLFALLFCCLNTIIAYGAFTEALNVWNASKVSAVLALSPIFTFISMEGAVLIWPEHFVASDLDNWSYIGALVVVLGSVIVALGRER